MINTRDLEGVRNFCLNNGLPMSAIEWLMHLHSMVQVIDDMYDRDKDIPQREVIAFAWSSLVGLPNNEFYNKNHALLSSSIATSLIKWYAATSMEEHKRFGPVSYYYTNAYFDVVLTVMCICKGWEWAATDGYKLADLFGESYLEYITEKEGKAWQQRQLHQ